MPSGFTGELPPIPSEFDISTEVMWSGGTGAIPPSAGPDVVGAFRFICTAGQLSYDDPVVFPGQPGKSHLHQFYGNLNADAHSTYESLRRGGESTCQSKLNRSAYWMPAMMNGKGRVVRPDFVTVYYKRYPESSPLCQRDGTACVDIPRGLRFVFGHDMLGNNGAPPGWFYFDCDGPTARPGHYPNIVQAAANCPVGNRLGAIATAPPCWDGRNLDAPNHRSHMSYPVIDNHTGRSICPTTHPYLVPHFTMSSWYTVDEDLDRSGTWQPGTQTWHLSSDIMPGMTHVPGSTFHADWFGAWDDTILNMWIKHCINLLLNCSGGDLGSGLSMKSNFGFPINANPRVVDPPPPPPVASAMHHPRT
jgi:hypothetical protein